MNKSSIIIIFLFALISLIVYLCQIYSVEFMVYDGMDEHFGLVKKVPDIYDMDPDFYDKYNYNYYDYIPVAELAAPHYSLPLDRPYKFCC